MAVDPRKFIIACPDKLKTTDKISAFGAISNISDLEIQSGVLSSLRTLVSIGNTAQANTIVGDGVTWVFDKLGLNYNLTRGDVFKFSPSVANNAIGAAKQIVEKIRAGNFSLEDIPQYVADFQNLQKLINNLYYDKAAAVGAIEVCESTHYASDLIAYAPKFKFMFVVEFVLNSGYQASMLYNGNLKPAAFCTNFERPQPTFEFEDVNMYNFRTKVLTKVVYPPANMTFYDDGQNHVMEFFQSYMRELSPLYRLEDPVGFENDGLDFTSQTRSSSMKQPSLSGHKTIFREIRLYHLWQSGYYFNLFRFFNPRIETITFDTLDMTDSQTTTIACQFNYDSMNVKTGLYFGGVGGENLQFSSALSDASELGASRLRFTGEKYDAANPELETDTDTLGQAYDEDAYDALGQSEDGDQKVSEIKANTPSVVDPILTPWEIPS